LENGVVKMNFQKFFTFIACVFLQIECSSGNGSVKDGKTDVPPDGENIAPAPYIESVHPGRGPLSGGTVVEVNGGNFHVGAKVLFASRESPSVEVRNSSLIVATTPPADAPGPVTLRVINPDGQSGELAGGFVYVESVGITWCSIGEPLSVTITAGEQAGPFTGIVEAPGITSLEGQGAGVSAEAGFGPNGSDPGTNQDWLWVEASFEEDCDGAVSGQMAADKYSALFSAVEPGSYDVAFRFSLDGGTTWTYCDSNPSDFPEYRAEDSAKLEVTGAPQIASCIIEPPAVITVYAGENSEPIFGRIEVPGYTDSISGRIDFILSQVGYGPDGSSPEASTRWEWKDANFDSDSGNQDRYSGNITAPVSQGSYDVAYRFSIDSGETWVYCDMDGSSNGYSPSSSVSLIVTEEPVMPDWCNLQYPSETWSGPGFPTDPIYGRVLMAGCTERTGACSRITAEFGYGPRGSDPTSGGWTWQRADYFKDVDQFGTKDADEYIIQAEVSSTEEYSYAYRFSADGGSNWILCDLDGSDDGFNIADAGYLRIVTTTVNIDWCVTQWPLHTSVPLGGETEMIYGQVYSASGDTASPGRAMNIIAELGFGPDGSLPGILPDTWTWKRANYNPSCSGCGNNDEFMATLSGFPSAGSYDYAYRFTGNWGVTWVYCDTSGFDYPAYTASEAGDLTVE